MENSKIKLKLDFAERIMLRTDTDKKIDNKYKEYEEPQKEIIHYDDDKNYEMPIIDYNIFLRITNEPLVKRKNYGTA